MKLDVSKRPQSERDIEECFVFIADANLDAGVTFLVRVEESLEKVSAFPFIGKSVTFGRDLYRVWPVLNFEKYLLFYKVTPTIIDLVRVLHQSRDIAKILE